MTDRVAYEESEIIRLISIIEKLEERVRQLEEWKFQQRPASIVPPAEPVLASSTYRSPKGFSAHQLYATICVCFKRTDDAMAMLRMIQNGHMEVTYIFEEKRILMGRFRKEIETALGKEGAVLETILHELSQPFVHNLRSDMERQTWFQYLQHCYPDICSNIMENMESLNASKAEHNTA